MSLYNLGQIKGLKDEHGRPSHVYDERDLEAGVKEAVWEAQHRKCAICCKAVEIEAGYPLVYHYDQFFLNRAIEAKCLPDDFDMQSIENTFFVCKKCPWKSYVFLPLEVVISQVLEDMEADENLSMNSALAKIYADYPHLEGLFQLHCHDHSTSTSHYPRLPPVSSLSHYRFSDRANSWIEDEDGPTIIHVLATPTPNPSMPARKRTTEEEECWRLHISPNAALSSFALRHGEFDRHDAPSDRNRASSALWQLSERNVMDKIPIEYDSKEQEEEINRIVDELQEKARQRKLDAAKSGPGNLGKEARRERLRKREMLTRGGSERILNSWSIYSNILRIYSALLSIQLCEFT